MTGTLARLVAAALLVVSVLGLGARPASAGTEDGTFVAWLDRTPAVDAQPGSIVQLGLMLWDAEHHAPLIGLPATLRVRPDSGGDPRSVALAEDWPGHYVTSLPVPDGGIDDFDVAVPGTACDAEGCRPADTIYPVAGVGVPPDAPLPLVAEAAISLASEPVAGRPVDVVIELTPKAAWEPGALKFPDQLVVQVRKPRGPVVEDVPAVPSTESHGTYVATATFPESDVVLQVATREQASAGDVFGTSLIAVQVAPAPALEIGGLLAQFAWLGVAAVVVLAASALVIAIRRA